MKKQWRIKNLITTTLALMSTIIASIFLVFIANWQISLQEDALYRDLDQLSDTINYNISSELAKMDQASLSILYSNTIRENFNIFVDIMSEGTHTRDAGTLYESGKILNDMVYTILTGEGAFSKIVLYDPIVGSYTFGPNTAYSNGSIRDQSWYPSLLADPSSLITAPYEDVAFSSETTYRIDRKYISLIRPYYSDYNTIDGYVEIVQNYDIIFDVLEAINYDPIYQIVLLDKNNEVINQAAETNISYESYVDYIMTTPRQRGVTEYETDNNTTDILLLKSFDNYPYKCLIIVDKDQLYQPIKAYLINFILLSLAIIAGVVLASLFISRTISEPIYHLYTIIKNTDIMDKNSLDNTVITTNILELNALWVALDNSHAKVRESMNQLIMVEQREVQSKMIALQSQMNPHFLYNSLSVLDSILEEERNDDAQAFCENLSSMLRYASSTEEPLVLYEEELEHTHTYLECMKYRYGDDLTFDFHIPDSMLQLRIPKLTVQSLVENAVKYATLKHAPWHISISAYTDNDYWFIQVSDNGFGFKEEVIEDLDKQLDLIKNGSFIPHLSLDGMGLLNLLYRIKLHCKSNPYLAIENLPLKGCQITIGGHIIHEENTDH